MHRFALGCLLAASTALAQTEPASSLAGDAEHIQRERQAAEQQYEAARRDCGQRFAVTACLDQARGARRKVLDALARRQALIDDARRRERAAQRLRDIEDRKARAAARPAEPARPLASGAANASANASTRAPAEPHAPQRPSVSHAAASAAAARAAAQAEQHRRERIRQEQAAEAHRRAVLEHDAERRAAKPAAAPLPLPPAASAAR